MAMSISGLEHLRSGSQVAGVYVRLLEQIVKGHLLPGAALSEKRLAEELGVSRTPVREALIKLSEDALVNIVPRSGTYVSPIDIEAVRDSQLIRESMECATVFLAARNVGLGEAEELRQNIAEQKACFKCGEHDRLLAVDDSLHRRLIEISGRRGVLKIVQGANLHLDRIRYMTIETTPHIAQIIAQHERIVDRVIAHDGRGARAAMREHQRMIFEKLDQLTWSHNVVVSGPRVAAYRALAGEDD